jgi:VanZ family protein
MGNFPGPLASDRQASSKDTHGNASPRLSLTHQLRQLRHVNRNPARLIFGEQLGRQSPSWLFLEIDIRQPVPVLSLGCGGIAMSADMKSRFRAGAKVCSGAIMILLVIAALGPAKWAPRTELGWQFDHFIGYFGITLFFCFAWPRPFVVGGVIMAVAALLEALQALTPDRSANLEAAFWGAAGALAAALVCEFLIRAWKWRLKRTRAAK